MCNRDKLLYPFFAIRISHFLMLVAANSICVTELVKFGDLTFLRDADLPIT
jgi:hypothetical protein